MMKKNKERIVINNWMVALLIIGNHEQESIMELSKKMDCTYSSLQHSTKELERRSIIIREKMGRRVTLRLTEKGKEIYESIRTIAKKTNIRNYQGWVIDEWGNIAKE
jgi:DNA-binding MarR family transcriptional regulator